MDALVGGCVRARLKRALSASGILSSKIISQVTANLHSTKLTIPHSTTFTVPHLHYHTYNTTLTLPNLQFQAVYYENCSITQSSIDHLFQVTSNLHSTVQ